MLPERAKFVALSEVWTVSDWGRGVIANITTGARSPASRSASFLGSWFLFRAGERVREPVSCARTGALALIMASVTRALHLFATVET